MFGFTPVALMTRSASSVWPLDSRTLRIAPLPGFDGLDAGAGEDLHALASRTSP